MSARRIALPVLVLVAAALVTSGPALAERPFSSLEERMTGQEYRETGLHKLSDEELAALNRWIRERSLTMEQREATERRDGDTDGDATVDRRGLPEESGRSTIRSRIAGTFRGWDGDTEFELENGMVWRQLESGTFRVSAMENPAVEIRPGALGSWQFSVEGYNRRIRVERIR